MFFSSLPKNSFLVCFTTIYHSLDNNEIHGLLGSSVNLLCNTSVPAKDRIVLIRWYNNSEAIGKPFYTIDSRISQAKSDEHADSGYQGRVYFDKSASHLRLSRIVVSDAGDYVCKVDYGKSVTLVANTKNRLHVIGK